MNSRERILSAINHIQPDKVPIDLGSSTVTGISAIAYNNLGIALARQGKIQEAIAHHHEALRIKPNLPEAHYSLGLAYLMIGNRESALEEYRILKTINPNLANTLSQKILK